MVESCYFQRSNTIQGWIQQQKNDENRLESKSATNFWKLLVKNHHYGVKRLKGMQPELKVCQTYLGRWWRICKLREHSFILLYSFNLFTYSPFANILLTGPHFFCLLFLFVYFGKKSDRKPSWTEIFSLFLWHALVLSTYCLIIQTLFSCIFVIRIH